MRLLSVSNGEISKYSAKPSSEEVVGQTKEQSVDIGRRQAGLGQGLNSGVGRKVQQGQAGRLADAVGGCCDDREARVVGHGAGGRACMTVVA